MADQMDIESDKGLPATSQPLSGPAPTAASSSHAPSSSVDNDKPAHKDKGASKEARRREDADILARLTDQSFNPADLGDPLTSERPLNARYEHQLSDGEKQFFAELEARVDEQIAKRRAQ